MPAGKFGGPALSVIIPFHGRMRELNKLLESLPDRADLEIILVDDRSPDPVEILRTFRSASLARFATTVEDRYAGSARNVGLDRARGEFVCFCDSDDTVVPEALLEVLDEAIASDYDVIYTYPTSVFEDGRPGTRTRFYEYLLDCFARTGNRAPLVRFHPPWAKLVRRGFVVSNDIRFEATRVSNDVMFNARLCAAGPRCGLHGASFYRVLQGNVSLTSDPDPEAILQRLEILRRYNRLLSETRQSRFRIPVSAQLRKLARRHPRIVLRELSRSLAAGEPLFMTPYLLGNMLQRKGVPLFRRRRADLTARFRKSAA